MLKKFNQERTGELLILAEVTLFSLFPLIITQGITDMPRILFFGITNLLSAPLFLAYMIAKGKLPELKKRQAWPFILGVIFMVIVFPSIAIALGAALADSITVAIFLQSELLFSFIFCGLLFNESITLRKTIGATIALLGALAILYQGDINVNLGAMYIVIGAIFYPFGNMSAKKSMQYVSSSTVLFLRSLIGGPILIAASLAFEAQPDSITASLSANIFSLVFTIFVIYFISKICWYEGIKRIEITKAASINTALPALSTIFTVLIFQELPTQAQVVGLFLVIIGLSQVVTKSKKLQYSPE